MPADQATAMQQSPLATAPVGTSNRPTQYKLHELNPLLVGRWTDTVQAVEQFLGFLAVGAVQADMIEDDHQGLDMALRVAMAALKVQRECGEYTPSECTLNWEK